MRLIDGQETVEKEVDRADENVAIQVTSSPNNTEIVALCSWHYLPDYFCLFDRGTEKWLRNYQTTVCIFIVL